MFYRVLGLALVLAAPAVAQEVTIGGGISTLGGQLEASYRLQPNVALRGFVVGGFGGDYESDEDIDGDAYNIKADASIGGAGLLADYYPMQSGWRVSGGLFFSSSAIDATFTGPETFDASLKMEREVAPMLTTGYRWDVSDQWSLAGDVGAIFSGLVASSDSTDADVQSEVADINAELNKYGAIPYLSLTASYRF